MIRVRLAYNPYTMSVSLNINGNNIKRSAKGYERFKSYITQRIPLQSWIDPIPYQNGWKGFLWEIVKDTMETEIEIKFTGRELDYEDFQQSIDYQSTHGPYKVDIKYLPPVFRYDDRTVLKQAQEAYELIVSDSFKQILDEKIFELGPDSDLKKAYDSLPDEYQKALDGEFRIVFSGMYTCGKSTLINAILGKDILPSSDRTCTSKVFKLYHDSSVEYAKMACVDENGNIVVEEQEYDCQTLSERFKEIFPRGDNDEPLPSNPPTIDTVIIKTSLASLYPSSASYDPDAMKLVLLDTPGTSSGEGNLEREGKSHVEITKAVIQSPSKEMIVFATSAIEDKDDSIQDFLDIVDNSGLSAGAYDQRFLFVMNKADCCSFREGESWESKLRGARKYYCSGEKERVISNPRFFPTSALGALEVRTGRLKSSDYKSVEAKYYIYDDDAEQYLANDAKRQYHFDEVCSTSQHIKNEIYDEIEKSKQIAKASERRAREVELHSGIVSLEKAIQEYVQKYAFPLKIQELLGKYEIIFKETKQWVDITKSKLDAATKAKTDVAAKKKEEEEKSEKEKKIRDSLTKIHEELNKNKSKLEAISTDFNAKANKRITTVKGTMSQAINEAERRAGQNKKSISIRNDTIKALEKAQTECERTIQSQAAESQIALKEIENSVNAILDTIRESTFLGDGFQIGDTTSFQKVSVKSIAYISDAKKRNPDYDSGFFLWRWIKRLWTEEYISDGIDLEKLYRALKDIRTEFNINVDNFFDGYKTNIEKAVSDLRSNLNELEQAIYSHQQQLKRIDKNVSDYASDMSRMQTLENKFSQFCTLLEQIRLVLTDLTFNRMEDDHDF